MSDDNVIHLTKSADPEPMECPDCGNKTWVYVHVELIGGELSGVMICANALCHFVHDFTFAGFDDDDDDCV